MHPIACVAKFGVDYVVPDMPEAKLLRSPYANACIRSVDATKARAIPGIVDILTWEDEDIKNLGGGDGGGSDGSTASSWAMKECANKLKKLILETAVEEANNPPAPAGFGMMGVFGAKQAPNPFKGLKPEDLDMQGGTVIVKADPSKGLPLAQTV